MCLLIAKPTQSHELPPVSYFVQANKANPDGIGVAFSKTGSKKVCVHKFQTFLEFLKFHEKAPYQENTSEFACVFHLRLATSGGVSKRLIHPFFLSGNPHTATEPKASRLPVVAHNGILPGITPNAGESDTLTFVREILTPAKIHSRNAVKPTMKRLVELSVGSYNKLALLFPGGELELFNKSSFHQVSGIFYSNRSYEPEKPRVSYDRQRFGYPSPHSRLRETLEFSHFSP